MSEAILSTPAITQEDKRTKEWTPAKVIYVFLMAFNLLSHFWLLATHTGINMPIYIWISRIAAALLAIYLGKLWKDRGFKILAIYTLLFSFRALIPNSTNVFTDDISESILSAIWLFAGCYGMARILKPNQLKSFLEICSALWIAGMAALSCIAIYAVWTQQRISLLNDAVIWLYNNGGVARLELVYLSTISGAILSITIIIGIILATCIKNRCFKTILFILVIPVIIALALTDSRTAYVCTAAGIAAIAFIAIIHIYQKKDKSQKTSEHKKNWKPWLFSILGMAIAFILVLIIILQITPVFNHYRTQGIIPRAFAESPKKIDVATRGFTSSHVLNGRAQLWIKIYNYFNQNKAVLLTGVSKLNPMSGINEINGHCHCIYIQILLESGILGLVLVAGFIFYTLTNTIRIITDTERPLWIRLLPVFIVALLVTDLGECFLWLRASYAPMTTVFFISAGILNTLVPKPNPKKKSLPEPAV